MKTRRASSTRSQLRGDIPLHGGQQGAAQCLPWKQHPRMSLHCMAAGVGVAKTDSQRWDRTKSPPMVSVGPHCQQVSPCSRCTDGPHASLILCAAGGRPHAPTGKGYSSGAGWVSCAAGRARTPIKSRRREAPQELCSAQAVRVLSLPSVSGPKPLPAALRPVSSCARLPCQPETHVHYLKRLSHTRGCNRSHPKSHQPETTRDVNITSGFSCTYSMLQKRDSLISHAYYIC